MNPENYCIPRRHRLLGETTKQTLRNFENISNSAGWGLTLVAYKKSVKT